MPDITMCASQGCPLATGCCRSPESGTRPSEWRQAWWAYRWERVGKDQTPACRHYWQSKSFGTVTTVYRGADHDR